MAVAVVMAVGISVFSVYVNRRSNESGAYMYVRNVAQSSGQGVFGVQSSSAIQQVITENIQGELRKGSFETVV